MTKIPPTGGFLAEPPAEKKFGQNADKYVPYGVARAANMARLGFGVTEVTQVTKVTGGARVTGVTQVIGVTHVTSVKRVTRVTNVNMLSNRYRIVTCS